MNRTAVSVQESDSVKSATKNNAALSRSSLSFLPTIRSPLASASNAISSLARPLIQPKLKIGAPNDKYEQEADRVADQVMRIPMPSNIAASSSSPQIQRNSPECENELQRQLRPTLLQINPLANITTPLVQRQSEPEEEEEEEFVQAKSNTGTVPQVTSGLAKNINSLKGSGQPLSESTRSYFEPRFGHDFSLTRIHTDNCAADLARRINARAFTFGRDIVFGSGQYKPDNYAGQRLLAHELTHVLQQDSNQIRREPYETRGISLDRNLITTMAGQNYWEQRTFQAYSTTTTTTRLSSDPEELDAVYSALWATPPPTTVTNHQEMIVPIAARTIPSSSGGVPSQTSELLYRFTFDPPVSGDPRPRLEISFVASGVGSIPIEAPSAPATYQPTQPGMTHQGFPNTGNQPGAYWQAHPNEHRELFHWMETLAPASFDQVITTTTRQQGTITHRSVFHVSGSHSGTNLNNLQINLVSQNAIANRQIVPADYRDRDRGDLELERLRDSSRATADQLGTVIMPAGLPANERLSVKFSIWQYFDAGTARNTEVDAIVPVGTGSRTVLYTFIFGANNEVTAIRIGESGSQTGQVDTRRIDVTRVRGFPGNSSTPGALRSWWSSRYSQGGTLTPDPPAPAQGQAVPISSTALINEMNQLITAGIANRNWFNQNYQIEVLDSQGTATRLQTAHNVPANMVNDTINFTATDLRMLELSLQTLTDDELTHLRDVKIGRKTTSINRNGTNYQAGPLSQYGVTLMDSTGSNMERTTLFFQSLYDNNPNLFRGSTASNALPDVTMGILHELGHAAGYNAGIETAFTTWLGQNPQAAPTWYAASGTGERFPEFYALYHTDPYFICTRYPLVYSWFETLSTTGSPPAAGAQLSAPGTCPPGPRVFIRVSGNSSLAQIIQANNLASQNIDEAALRRLNPGLHSSTTIATGTKIWLHAREVPAMETGFEATVVRYFGNRFRWPTVWSFNPDIRDPASVQPTTRIHLQSVADRRQFGEVSIN